MKVLITGAGGFIGSHLAERCCELGYEVKAFVHYNSNNSWGWLDSSTFKKEMEIISGDIRDYDLIEKTVQGCDTIFHLAALISIPYSYISPIAFTRTNVEGTYNVLYAARKFSPSNILITSTSETYGTAQYVPINEKHPVNAQSPYAASKVGADQLALSFYCTYQLPVKIVRPFNTYGPRQSTRAIIPTIITQLLSDSNTLALGNLTPTRDLTHVHDTVSGFLEIAKAKELIGEVTNIGMNHEISVRDLIEKIAQIIGVQYRIEEDDARKRPPLSEVERLYCDNSKLKQHTAWSPKYELRTGLEATIPWYRTSLDLYKPGLYHV